MPDLSPLTVNNKLDKWMINQGGSTQNQSYDPINNIANNVSIPSSSTASYQDIANYASVLQSGRDNAVQIRDNALKIAQMEAGTDDGDAMKMIQIAKDHDETIKTLDGAISRYQNWGSNMVADQFMSNGLPKSIEPVSNIIPTGSSISNISSTPSVPLASPVTDRRVRIRPKSGLSSFIGNSTLLQPLLSTNGAIFPFTPNVTITRSAKYSSRETVHNIQDYKTYNSTSAASVTITGVFTAQNDDEAKYLLACNQFFKSMLLMTFGQDSSGSHPIGAPPPVLLLSGYGTYMMNDIPIILEDYDMPLPDDVDYMEISIDGTSTFVPVKTTITIKATVQKTPADLRKFDWYKYLSGDLTKQGGWY